MLAHICRPLAAGRWVHPFVVPPVHNPYGGRVLVHIGLEAVGSIGACTGHTCTSHAKIVAGRLVSVAWRGMHSSGICLQLPDPDHQDAGGGLDALGAVQRQQHGQAVLDLAGSNSVCDQLFNFSMSKN